MAKLKLPPIPAIRTIELNRDERQFLEGCLDITRQKIVAERDTGALLKDEAARLLKILNDLSDKIMPEEEAAAILQGLGFEIVEKKS